MIPPAIRNATHDFITRSDLVQGFVDEMLARDPAGRLGAKEAYALYQSWSLGAGVHPMSRPQFGTELEKAGPKNKDRLGWCYSGWKVAGR